MSTRTSQIRNEAGEIVKAGCVVFDSGKVLLVCDSINKIYSFPKGHVEAGETVKQAATRETLEETGCKVEIISQLPDLVYAHGQTGEPIRVSMFLAKPTEINNVQGGITSEWVNIQRAKELLYPNLLPYIQKHQ